MDKPFDKSFVLKITTEKMKQQIDRSLTITYDRLKDRPDKKMEILETIDVLTRMRRMLIDFEEHNPIIYGAE